MVGIIDCDRNRVRRTKPLFRRYQFHTLAIFHKCFPKTLNNGNLVDLKGSFWGEGTLFVSRNFCLCMSVNELLFLFVIFILEKYILRKIVNCNSIGSCLAQWKWTHSSHAMLIRPTNESFERELICCRGVVCYNFCRGICLLTIAYKIRFNFQSFRNIED